MRMVSRKNTELILYLKAILERTILMISIGITILTLEKEKRRYNGHRRKFSITDRIPAQIQNMADLVQVSDEDCRNKFRMDRSCFYRLCHLLQDVGGLKSSKYINVYDKVAMFLSILTHHSKNRCVKFQFKRSGQTVSKQFHLLHYLLLVKPTPIPNDSNDTRWGNFKVTSCNTMEPHAPGTGNDVVKGKASRGRRSWSRVEEDSLIGCLIDIVNDGWKTDNGFKAGFQRELEKGMRKIFPGTDLVANLHINSKIHVWKKEYSALSDLLSKSGIG
ncbi:hypothetical protein ACS0TY_014068 [Phlomoides rotata]